MFSHGMFAECSRVSVSATCAAQILEHGRIIQALDELIVDGR
jgi:hypothetical protein